MTVIAFGSEVELAERLGQQIEVLRVGTFTDGRGRKVTITEADLDQFVANFNSGAAGQEIPFDIDHEFSQAAGWLRGLERRNDILLAMPEWNDLGVELIQKKIYRYISATIDMAKKVIASLSLVNFPAVKGLAPIQLSENTEPTGGEHPIFGAPLASLFFFSSNQETTTMTEDTNLQDGAENQGGQSNQQPAAQNPATQQEGGQQEQSAVNGLLATLRQQMAAEITQFQAAMAAEIAKLSEQRSAMVATTLAQLREEQELAQLSMKLTSTGNNALPTTPNELQALLTAIPQPQRQSVIALLENIYRSGLVTFSEVGTSNQRQQTNELGPEMAAVLSAHLAEGGKIEDFFNVNADLLGPMASYDLRKFTK